MQPLLTQNFFELFHLAPVYALDSAELAQRYRDLQQVVHPDRFAHASEQERRLSMQCATHVNAAFQTLKDPLLRAGYLLEIRGVAIDQTVAMAPDFLMEQMELREQLEALVQQPDAIAALMALRDDLDQRIRVLQQTFTTLLGMDDSQADEHSEALQVFNKMQFLYRLQQELDSQEEDLLG